MKKKNYKIPFTLVPACHNHPERWEMEEDPWYNEYDTTTIRHYAGANTTFDVEWRDIYEFETTMEIVTWYQRRSKVRVVLKGEDHTLYSTTFNSFMEIIEAGIEIKDNTISKMKWTFGKKGQYYMALPVIEKENKNG